MNFDFIAKIAKCQITLKLREPSRKHCGIFPERLDLAAKGAELFTLACDATRVCKKVRGEDVVIIHEHDQIRTRVRDAALPRKSQTDPWLNNQAHRHSFEQAIKGTRGCIIYDKQLPAFARQSLTLKCVQDLSESGPIWVVRANHD